MAVKIIKNFRNLCRYLSVNHISTAMSLCYIHCMQRFDLSSRLPKYVFNLNIFRVGSLSRRTSELLDSSVSQTDDIDSQCVCHKSKDMYINMTAALNFFLHTPKIFPLMQLYSVCSLVCSYFWGFTQYTKLSFDGQDSAEFCINIAHVVYSKKFVLFMFVTNIYRLSVSQSTQAYNTVKILICF